VKLGLENIKGPKEEKYMPLALKRVLDETFGYTTNGPSETDVLNKATAVCIAFIYLYICR
jgi:hypothetical protein